MQRSSSFFGFGQSHRTLLSKGKKQNVYLAGSRLKDLNYLTLHIVGKRETIGKINFIDRKEKWGKKQANCHDKLLSTQPE
jgi:hypothetical protein